MMKKSLPAYSRLCSSIFGIKGNKNKKSSRIYKKKIRRFSKFIDNQICWFSCFDAYWIQKNKNPERRAKYI